MNNSFIYFFNHTKYLVISLNRTTNGAVVPYDKCFNDLYEAVNWLRKHVTTGCYPNAVQGLQSLSGHLGVTGSCCNLYEI